MVEQYTTSQVASSPQCSHISSLRSSSSAFRILHQRSDILLASKEGTSLPIEICLKIVEDVVSSDPRVGTGALMTLSMGFYTLLRTYQHSIVKTVSSSEGTYDIYPTILLPSWPRNVKIVVRSYSWLCEVRCRTHTIESLIKHQVTNMKSGPGGRIAIDLPIPDVPKSELSIRIERFKRDALYILYGMADSTAVVSETNIHAIRAHQRLYLESLTTTQLAILGVFVRVLGLGYFRLTRCNHPNKTSDSIRDGWIVFEDRILRYGPFFAWATVIRTEGVIRDWSDEMIAQALADMEAFETGRVKGYASLQSVLWRLFCTRKECNMFDSWDEAREVVETEMLGYDI